MLGEPQVQFALTRGALRTLPRDKSGFLSVSSQPGLEPSPGAASTLRRKPRLRLLLALAAAAVSAGGSALGINLLLNPGFEANNGNVVAANWTYFEPPNGGCCNYFCDTAWANAHSGNLYWKQWGIYWDAARTNVAGIYQQFSSAPTSVYQAGGWFFTKNDAQQSDAMGPKNKAWLEVTFRNSSGQVLGLYKSADFTTGMGVSQWFNLPVTNVCDLSQPIPSGDTNSAYMYYAVTGGVNVLVAPPGTAFVRYQFAMVQGGGLPEGGGSVYFDDAELDQISGPLAPTITSLSPPNPSMFVDPHDGLTFRASSPSGTAISDIGVVLNGADVSSSLTISGTASTRDVSYSGLQSNTQYTAFITVTDAFNLTASATTWFETTWVGIQPVIYLWEAEDFDFLDGSYINFPDPCTASGIPNCYFGKIGLPGFDENEIAGAVGEHLYRPDDPMATTVSGDLLRKNLASVGRLDYKVGLFESGEWVNYTRDWPAGTYWIVARLANGGGPGTLTLSKTTAGATNALGTFTLANGRGWTAYDFCYLKDSYGNIASVALNGRETLRTTTGGNVDMGFFALVQAQTDLPILTSLYPDGSEPFQDTNQLSFTVTSQGGTISPGGIKLMLDGVDVSADLSISGPASTRNVVFPYLVRNALHSAILTVTNANGVGFNKTYSFDTFSMDNYMVDSEDFDFFSGQFFSDPPPGAYYAFPATAGID